MIFGRPELAQLVGQVGVHGDVGTHRSGHRGGSPVFEAPIGKTVHGQHIPGLDGERRGPFGRIVWSGETVRVETGGVLHVPYRDPHPAELLAIAVEGFHDELQWSPIRGLRTPQHGMHGRVADRVPGTASDLPHTWLAADAVETLQLVPGPVKRMVRRAVAEARHSHAHCYLDRKRTFAVGTVDNSVHPVGPRTETVRV